MTNKAPVDTTKFTLPVSSIKEIVKIEINLLHDLKHSINEQTIPWATTGILDYDFITRSPSYGVYYDVPLKDPVNSTDCLLLIIPEIFIEINKIIGGEHVTVIGYLKVNYFKNQFSVQFKVIGLNLDKDNLAVPQTNKLLLDFLKRLTVNRIPFPINRKLKIAVISPESGDAYLDFQKEIQYGKYEIVKYSTNFLSKEYLLDKISLIESENTFNILVLIRGGGATTEFSVFDDLEICQKVAAIKCHKVIGLGHSSNRTLLELVVDNALQTPTAVGRYINSNIQKQFAIHKQNIRNEESRKLNSKIKFKQVIINILLFLVICFVAILYYFFTNYNGKDTHTNAQTKIAKHVKKK